MEKKLIADKYELVKALDYEDQMTVYLATNTEVDEQLIVQILDREACEDEETKQEIKKEEDTFQTMVKSSFSPMKDVGWTNDGRFFMVLDYRLGKSVEEAIFARKLREGEIDTSTTSNVSSALPLALIGGTVIIVFIFIYLILSYVTNKVSEIDFSSSKPKVTKNSPDKARSGAGDHRHQQKVKKKVDLESAPSSSPRLSTRTSTSI